MFLIFELFHLYEVVGTVEGGRAPTKIKADLKKPIVNLACHPRLPVLVTCLILLRLLYLPNLKFANILTLVLMDAFSNFFPFLFQYVAYADGWIRAYNIHTYAVHYTLQREMDVTVFFLNIGHF